MKLVLLLLAAAAAVVTTQRLDNTESEANILLSDVEKFGVNNFTSVQITSNNIRQSASGKSVPGAEPETGSYIMSGKYSYISPEGKNITVTWYADETGFHAESDAIPKNVEPLGQF